MKKQFAIVLCLILLCTALTGCSKEVAVDVSGLTQITLSGNTTAVTGQSYTATLIPAKNFELPKTITVTVDGAALTEGYTYDPATGALTVEAGSVTGSLAISGTATESIVGKWEATKDMTAMFNDYITKADPTTAKYFNFTNLTLDMTMEFTAEGTCKIEFSQDSFTTFIQAVTEGTIAGMNKMLEDMLASQNINLTVEQFLAFTGVSMEDMIKEAMSSVKPEEMLGELTGTSNYKVEDGKLYTSENAASTDYKDVNPYTVKDGVLTIEGILGDSEQAEALKYFFPLTLNRVVE